MSYSIVLPIFLSFIIAACVPWFAKRSKPLPPGPAALPLLGNLHMIPRTGIHLKYTQWAKEFGPIFSLNLGRGTMVVLSSASYATGLLDKRSLKYSDRPASHVLGDMLFEGDHPMLMNADERWKLRRKLYYQMLQESKCDKDHLALVEAEAVQLVQDICLEPSNLMLHPGRYSNSIIMSLVFGIRTPRHDTPHYLGLREFLTRFSALGEIGATPPVDLLPWLKYLPEVLWGNWKTQVRELRDIISSLHTPLVDHVVERRAKFGSRNSFLDGVLDQQDKLRLSKNEIDIMCGNLLEGGTDTMATLILTLCQALALHPDVLAEAHREIDTILDERTMPSFTDYPRLPFIAMIVKELLRWRPPAPTAFPHAIGKGDEVDGMTIPPGSTVILNIWGIHHDANRYSNPEEFNPRRFEGQTQLASVYANSGDHQKRDHFGYGAGRRICPGIHLAERALFLATVKILWGFTIRPKVDAVGMPLRIDVAPESGYRDGFLNQCRPFKLDIKVRSEKRQETILANAAIVKTKVFSIYS